MADVRLTATNPDDSSVVPVACNEKGELKLEEPLVVEGPPGEPGPPGEQGLPGEPGLDAPQWEYGYFTPEYGSSDKDNTVLIEYMRQWGWYAKLGNMVWIKCMISTNSVFFTNIRGNLLIKGIPFTWASSENQSSTAGGAIGFSKSFAEGVIPLQAYAAGTKRVIVVRGFHDDDFGTLPIFSLAEGEASASNDLHLSYFGLITSTDTPVRNELDWYEKDAFERLS